MPSSPKLRFRRAFLLALLLHAAAYLPSLPNGFVFDDHAIVEGQPEVRGEAPLSGVFSTTWFHQGRDGGAIAYRPVSLASLGLDVRLCGLAPAPLRADGPQACRRGRAPGFALNRAGRGAGNGKGRNGPEAAGTDGASPARRGAWRYRP